MIKTLTKVGNSHGIIFDTTLMDLARLKPGEQLNVEVHEGGTITLTPVRAEISADAAKSVAKRVIGKNDELFRRLS
ncbi:MAG: hypothetical protein QM680_06180 [Luteolibacter sp.]